MKKFQYDFFILALFSVIFMMGIGIFIAEKNTTLAFVSFCLMIITIGTGFVLKVVKRKRKK